jgi:XXXCH domain-containing protein
MKDGDRKLEIEMGPEDLPGFLRELAAAFETEVNRNAVSTDSELQNHIQSYKKLRLSLKRKASLINVKLKVKKQDPPAQLAMTTGADETETAAAEIAAAEAAVAKALNDEKPKYKTLKKRMKSNFKEIRARLEELRLPEEVVVQQFCDDSALMVTYPGKGNTYYPRYTQVVSELKTAYERKDFAVFNALVSTLDGLMNDCHREFK